MAAIAFSLVATAISTVAVIRTEKRSISVTTYHSATELTLQVDRTFIEHPELRPLFYENVLLEGSGHDAYLVLAVAELMLDVLECVWDQEREYSTQDREAWKAWILDVFASSPTIRDLYDEASAWYPTLSSLLRSSGFSSAAELAPRNG